jgi:hypothetical protein
VPLTAEQKRLDAESGVSRGYWTVNEARIATGKDPVPNGDVLLVELNRIPTPVSGKVTSTQNVPPDGKNYTSDVTYNSNLLCDDNMLKGDIYSTKGLTPDQKRLHWEAYAKKTERQEEMFNKVFESVFNDQKDYVISELERIGHLPVQLDDEKTADKFKPAIELVYQSGFEDAV